MEYVHTYYRGMTTIRLRSPLFIITVLALVIFACGGPILKRRNQKALVYYVDPFIGTDFHGHTFPGATLPFSMVQLSPDTRTLGWDACAGYHYSDSSILGGRKGIFRCWKSDLNG